jgi:hypothetical protein
LETAAETSSCAAGISDLVEGAAAAVAALIVSRIPDKSDDAAARTSGAAITYEDICGSDYYAIRPQ